jgi:hypothetical protein
VHDCEQKKNYLYHFSLNERKRKKPKNRVSAWSFSFHLQLKNVNKDKKKIDDAWCQKSFFSKYLTHRLKKKKLCMSFSLLFPKTSWSKNHT